MVGIIANPFRYLSFKLIEEDSFQKKLNILSKFNYQHFEKWFQVELASFLDINKCNHFSQFTFFGESMHEKRQIIPDFTIVFKNSRKRFYIEIKQYNSFTTCLRFMAGDFIKIKDVIGIKNCMDINCIGIFKSLSFSNEKLLKVRDDFKKHKYLSIKLNKIKIKEIPNTEYSIMYI